MNHAEQTLLDHLPDPASLDYLSAEGVYQAASLKIVPNELVRKITAWAIESYWESGRKAAPSREATREVWGDQMEALEIDFGDPTEEIDSIQGVVATLRAKHASGEGQKLVREVATKISRADPNAKVAAVLDGARRLHQLAQTLSSRRFETDLATGFEDALLREAERRTTGRITHGLTLGMPLIDNHTHGIHPGELAIFAMTSGGGKSWLLGRTLLNEWSRGRKAVLVTLENDLEMTSDRLVCMLASVDYESWQAAETTEEERERVLICTERLLDSPVCPDITMLREGERDPLSIVRRAHTFNADSLIIDQFSYIESVPGSRTNKRNEQAAEILRTFRSLLNDEAGKLPALIAAQINREGRKAARATGRFEFEHLGLTTELENIADFVWAGYQSADHEALERAVFQELKFRRGKKVDFDMWWRLNVGDIRPIGVHEGAS